MANETENLKGKLDRYLDYLDKEMGIMGDLSTFCLAVPSLFFERVISAATSSIAHDLHETLWRNGSLHLIIASILMFAGAAFFNKQPSQLAWYYRQIALKMALPDYTARALDENVRNNGEKQELPRIQFNY